MQSEKLVYPVSPSPEKIYRLALEMIVQNPAKAVEIATQALLEVLNG